MNIGKAIVELRKERGISQENLAFEAELSRHYMYKLENNLASPTIHTLEKIAVVLSLNPSELLEKAQKLPPL